MAIERELRISFNIDFGTKSLLERASLISGVSMSEFVKIHSLHAAKNIVEKFETISLSERDSLIVIDALENPRAPNQRMLDAAIRLKRV